jgi:hypothetical protein
MPTALYLRRHTVGEFRQETLCVKSAAGKRLSSDFIEHLYFYTCFSGFDPPLMAQGSQAIRESSSVPGEGNSLGR